MRRVARTADLGLDGVDTRLGQFGRFVKAHGARGIEGEHPVEHAAVVVECKLIHDPVDEKSYRTYLGLEGTAFHGWRRGGGHPLDHSPNLSRCMSS